MKVLYFRTCRHISVSNKISSDKKSYKHFIGYLYDDYKIKPLNIMLPKSSVFVKSYDDHTKYCIF